MIEDETRRWLIGIEIESGLMVRALVASGSELVAVNPLSVDRYRDRVGCQNSITRAYPRVRRKRAAARTAWIQQTSCGS